MIKPRRQYAVFVKRGRKWSRISHGSYTLEACRRLYQDVLLAGFMNGVATELKPVSKIPEDRSVIDENWQWFKIAIHATVTNAHAA